MKLISPKTLFISLLCGIYTMVKVISFDDFSDLFLIAFFGYLTFKCIMIAFSQQAFDTEKRQTEQSRAMYLDLFGRFAYIAPDIPLILILSSGGIALIFFPITLVQALVLCLLLLLGVGYALWFSWYISKHKKLRVEDGTWDSSVLTPEEERTWARSDLIHDILGGCLILLCLLYLVFGNPRIHINNDKLKQVFTQLDTATVTLEEVVPFPWTTVYTFDPYTSREQMEKITGTKSPMLKECVNEGMTHFVFMNRGHLMASVCAYPSSAGYSLAFTGGKNTYYDYRDGGYSHIEYGDGIEFSVTREDGVVRLYAVVAE